MCSILHIYLKFMMYFPNKKERNRKIGAFSHKTSKWIGSTNSLVAHTIFFVAMLTLAFTTDIGFDKIMLVLTTIVSLEAIYLSIFIQMTVNRHSEELEEVSEDIEEIQENVDEIQEDIEDIHEDEVKRKKTPSI